MFHLIKNAFLTNEDEIKQVDVLIHNQRIKKIASRISPDNNWEVTDAQGLYLMPGMIDTHVHFREPGFLYKGNIATESRAAVAGGITSYMDMPNTFPNATSISEVEKKFTIASRTSYANYSFYFGIQANNLEEALRIDNSIICGLTDDGLYFDQKDSLLCNRPEFLEQLFSRSNSLIALHCEDEKMIQANEQKFLSSHGNNVPPPFHALIRNEEACYKASQQVVAIAQRYNTRTHLLHLSTAKEMSLLRSDIPIAQKRITGEVCLHHLYFSSEDYQTKGFKIKWNPSIKEEHHRQALLQALANGALDSIGSDHAPHSIEEKNGNYWQCKSGGPLVQHALPMLTELFHRKELALTNLVRKACHNPSELFKVIERGYVREGYYADLVLVNLSEKETVRAEKLRYTCGWSPLESDTLRGKVEKTFVNGSLVYDQGTFLHHRPGMRLCFSKER